MHDFRCTSSEDMFYPLLARQVRHFRETEGGQKVVCKAVEEIAAVSCLSVDEVKELVGIDSQEA